MGTKQYTDQLNKALKELYSWCLTRELKHATFLSHGRQPEVNISHARTVVSLTFSNLSYLLVKRDLTTLMWQCDEKLNTKTTHFRLPSVAQKLCMLKLPNNRLT